MNETNVKIRLDLIKEADICLTIKDLATKKPWPDPSVDLIVTDVDWLIEQAERAQELEVWEETARNYFGENVSLKDENKRFREALTNLKESVYIINMEANTKHYLADKINQALEVERCD